MTFDDQPKSYEEKRRFRYELQDYMHEEFQFNKFAGKKILELGSGAGIDSAEFLRNGAEVVSVDFSSLSVRSTKHLLEEADFSGHVVMADAKHLPFRDSQFDAVYSFGVIHHINEVADVLNQIVKVLRSGGLFLGMVYNRLSLLYAYSIIYLHGILEGLFAQGLTESEIAAKFSERMTGNPYTRVYDKGELRELLGKFFRDVSIETHYNVIDTPDKRKVKFNLENGEENLGWHLAFRATKPFSAQDLG